MSVEAFVCDNAEVRYAYQAEVAQHTDGGGVLRHSLLLFHFVRRSALLAFPVVLFFFVIVAE